MKRLIALAILLALLVGLALSNITDTSISNADTTIADNEVTSSGGEANNSSPSATITITMYAVAEGHPGWRRF